MKKDEDRTFTRKCVEIKSEVKKCELRLDKLVEMQNTLSARLGDPKVYEETMKDKRLTWQKKYSEVMDAIQIAEKLWVRASEKLEKLSNI